MQNMHHSQNMCNKQKTQKMPNVQEMQSMQNMQNQTYQTNPAESDLQNQTKPNLFNQTCQTKPNQTNWTNMDFFYFCPVFVTIRYAVSGVIVWCERGLRKGRLISKIVNLVLSSQCSGL